MKRWQKITGLSLALSLIFLGIFFFYPRLGDKPKVTAATTTSGPQDFWIISDNHLLARSLFDDGEAFTKISKTTAGKDLLYDEDLTVALVAKALKEKPQGIILTGDLTLNGEKESLKALAKIFAPLKAAGIALLAIPGNHDLYDGWARAFQGDKQVVVDQISPQDFTDILPDGFTHSQSRDEKSLSYTIDFGTYRFFMMDSTIHTIEPSKHVPITAGHFTDETLAWLEEQLAAAQKAGKTPLMFLHHNLLPHNPRMTKGWVLNNADEVLPLMTKYHVPVAFAGHIHLQDIMANQEENFYEVLTSSFSIVESHIGHLRLTADSLQYQVENFDPTPYFTKEQLQNPDLADYPTYIHDLFKKDQENLAYQQLFAQDIYDEKITDPIAELFGEAHVRYFTGNNTLSAAEIAKIKASPAYQLAEKYDFAKNLASSFTDSNTPNNRELKLTIPH